METNKLSDAKIRRLKPREKPYKASDGGGLHLRVTPSGGLLWRIKFRVNGRERQLGLGSYPFVSLAEARKQRDKIKEQLASGLDPSLERQNSKAAEREAAAHTFEAVAREWVDQQRARWKTNHADSVLKQLEADLFPALGNKAIAEITAPELLAVLRAIEARRAYETLKKARQRAGAIFRFGVATGRCDRDVAADLRGAFASPRTKSHNALSVDELPEFLRRLDGYDGHPQTRLALWLVLLTATRTGEVRWARWNEFEDLDGDDPIWRIPSTRMKAGREHLVPLSIQAVAVLRELKTMAGPSELVLPGRSSLVKPISENTL